MSISFTQLQELLKAQEYRFFVDPERPRLMFGATGEHGKYQVMLMLELDGKFLQFRSADFYHCPTDHPHLDPVLKAIHRMNYERRFVKVGWDLTDGEIVVYGDLWLSDDGTIGNEQFGTMLGSYLRNMDSIYALIRMAAEKGKTGEDGDELDSL
jgi:hypothetical protein